MGPSPRKSRSSFDGHIEDIPDIFVDNFENTNKKAYFLSHCHSDHTQGLYSQTLVRDMERNGAKIYMTEETMKIVSYLAGKEGNYNICSFIQPLKLSTTTVTIGDNLHIEVTLIPAGHCLGSVMFLFRIKNKTILYTGDFNIRSNDISKYAQFQKKDEPIHIDVMYVDTTFLTYDHPEFAKRSDSVDEMIDKVDKWLKADPYNRVAIHTSAMIGYEYLFNQIHKRLGIKVSVEADLWFLYCNFPKIASALSVIERDPKIHYCKNIRYKWKCQHNDLKENNYLSVHFSAMSWQHYDDEQTALRDSRDGINVCFATHCSRREIISFVNYFTPGKVVGFPEPYITDSPVKVFDDEYIPSPKKRMLNLEPDARKVDTKLVKNLF